MPEDNVSLLVGKGSYTEGELSVTSQTDRPPILSDLVTMKETAPILYPNDIVGDRVSYYAEAQSSRIPQHIIDYHIHVRETQPKTANYMISISQAQAMAFLARMIGAKRGITTSQLHTPPTRMFVSTLSQRRQS